MTTFQPLVVAQIRCNLTRIIMSFCHVCANMLISNARRSYGTWPSSVLRTSKTIFLPSERKSSNYPNSVDTHKTCTKVSIDTFRLIPTSDIQTPTDWRISPVPFTRRGKNTFRWYFSPCRPCRRIKMCDKKINMARVTRAVSRSRCLAKFSPRVVGSCSARHPRPDNSLPALAMHNMQYNRTLF